jgi:hypothetical protein
MLASKIRLLGQAPRAIWRQFTHKAEKVRPLATVGHDGCVCATDKKVDRKGNSCIRNACNADSAAGRCNPRIRSIVPRSAKRQGVGPLVAISAKSALSAARPSPPPDGHGSITSGERRSHARSAVGLSSARRVENPRSMLCAARNVALRSIARSKRRVADAWSVRVAASSAARPSHRCGRTRAIAHQPVGKSPIADRFRSAQET